MSDPMPVPTTGSAALSDRSGVTDAVRTQILATEHWSLLATRGLIWNEVFARSTMYLTVLSAATVALALVAQATDFGPTFRTFALLVLPIVLIVGIGTVVRLDDANTNDFGLMIGMNRLRHAYLELAPELEPYFVTGSHDDQASIVHSFNIGIRVSYVRYLMLATTPAIIAAINAVVIGIFVALIADTLGGSDTFILLVGGAAALVAVAAQAAFAIRSVIATHRALRPRFPA